MSELDIDDLVSDIASGIYGDDRMAAHTLDAALTAMRRLADYAEGLRRERDTLREALQTAARAVEDHASRAPTGRGEGRMSDQCRARHPAHRDECHKLATHGGEHHNVSTGRRWSDAAPGCPTCDTLRSALADAAEATAHLGRELGKSDSDLRRERDTARSEITTLRARVDELEALLADTAAWRIRDALPLGLWRDALDRAIPLDDLRCPLCGSDVIWSCQGTPGAVARAHCGRGMHASRVGSVGEQACPWKGTRIARLASLAVVALYPVEVARG